VARTAGSDGGRTEKAIRAAAVALIARQGYEAVSMRQLAEAVGVQAGALYRYFPNKQAMLASLMVDHMERLLGAWRAARPAGADPVARLDAFAGFHVRYHIDRRDEVFVNYMELRSLEPENRAAVVALRDAYERDLRTILQDGLDAGRFAPLDPALTSMGLIAMLTGVTMWRRSNGRLGAAEIAARYRDLTLRMVGADGVAVAAEGI